MAGRSNGGCLTSQARPNMNHKQAEETNAIAGYLLNELSEEDNDAFEEHMLGCRACTEEVKFFTITLPDILRDDPEFDGRFHSRHAAAAYVLDDLDRGEREAFEKHLVTCQPCAQHVKSGTTIFENFQNVFREPQPPSTRRLAALRFSRWFRLAFRD